MARTGWRGLVSCLLVLTCLSKLLPGPLIVEAAWLSRQLGDPAAAVAAGTWSDRVPVVLVHGLRGSGPGSWGAPADEGDWPSRIYRSLCREGYTPGRDLFVCDYSNDHLGDYREIARRNLAPVIAHACAVSGWDRVDILARSMGGLVARAYLSSELYRGDVRTLVMLATPHQGSFGAGIVKTMETESEHLLQIQVGDCRAAAEGTGHVLHAYLSEAIADRDHRLGGAVHDHCVHLDALNQLLHHQTLRVRSSLGGPFA